MKPNSLQELYAEEIKDLYDAESRIVKTLPKLVDASSSSQLRAAFSEHLTQTQDQVRRLEQIFARLGMKPSGKTCDGMKGILEEGSHALDLDAGVAKDAALIAGAQRVEHYEIAAYGTVKNWAQQMNRTEDVRLLQQTLDEEKGADVRLTGLAEGGINAGAESGQAASETPAVAAVR